MWLPPSPKSWRFRCWKSVLELDPILWPGKRLPAHVPPSRSDAPIYDLRFGLGSRSECGGYSDRAPTATTLPSLSV